MPSIPDDLKAILSLINAYAKLSGYSELTDNTDDNDYEAMELLSNLLVDIRRTCPHFGIDYGWCDSSANDAYRVLYAES